MERVVVTGWGYASPIGNSRKRSPAARAPVALGSRRMPEMAGASAFQQPAVAGTH